MARSRAMAISALPPAALGHLLVTGGERLHLATEVVDAGLERRRRPVAQVQHRGTDDRDDHGDHEEGDGVHRLTPPPASTMCCASRPQLSPSAQVSRFQIGTDRLSESMQNLAASN